MCMKNNVDPDELASSEASWSGSTVFSSLNKCIMGIDYVEYGKFIEIF